MTDERIATAEATIAALRAKARALRDEATTLYRQAAALEATLKASEPPASFARRITMLDAKKSKLEAIEQGAARGMTFAAIGRDLRLTGSRVSELHRFAARMMEKHGDLGTWHACKRAAILREQAEAQARLRKKAEAQART